MKKHLFRALLTALLIASTMLPLVACTVKDVSEETTDVVRAEQTNPESESETETPVDPIDPAVFGEADITYVCDDGSILSTYNEKTAADFEGVCAYYEGEGYTVYSASDMGGNPAATYVKGDAMAHIYHHPSNGELNIVLSDTAGGTLPPATPAVTDGSYTCTVTQMMDATNVNGMGYIIRLADGSYIVYDGAYEGQAKKILKVLKNDYKGDGLPTVRAWVLTHSHNDHYPAFTFIANKDTMREQIKVENIIIAPMNDENYFMDDPNDYDPYFSTAFYEDAAKLEGANIVFAHTGMTFTFCNLKMEILYAPESHYKTHAELGNFNNTSIVSRLYDDSYSALFTADVGIQGSTIMENLYGEYLRSDICQISHHGVEDVPLSFYEKVQAAILYYPCNQWLYDQTDRHWEERQAMEDWACTKEILIAGLGQYTRAWGTKFDADAPLSMPDYTPPAPPAPPAEDDEVELPVDASLLSSDKTTYKVGESILVTAVGSGTDWVGIAPVGSTGSACWWYVTAVGSGTPFDLTTTVSGDGVIGEFTAGEYLIALVPNDQPWASGDYTATVTITIEE